MMQITCPHCNEKSEFEEIDLPWDEDNNYAELHCPCCDQDFWIVAVISVSHSVYKSLDDAVDETDGVKA